MTAILSERDANGIVTLIWNMAGRSMNVLSEASLEAFYRLASAAIEDPAVRGVIVTSGKPTFIVGADLEMMLSQCSVEDGEDASNTMRRIFAFNAILNGFYRRLETSGKPFVAAINGTALGGGLELCLACHHRLVADNDSIQLGLPESKVGLLPGGGGTQRLPRLAGIKIALPLLLQGTLLSPRQALSAGIVHRVVPADRLLDEARELILAGATSVQPWDVKGFRIPDLDTLEPQYFADAIAACHARTFGNYPAQEAILSCVYEGTRVPLDAGVRVEARYMALVMAHPTSRNMIRSLFTNMQRARKGVGRPPGFEKAVIRKIGVIGAGMMGAGIAYEAASAAIDVVLIDRTKEAAARGKEYSEKLLVKKVQRGEITDPDKTKTLDRIQIDDQYQGLADADLVIEAVFEDRAVKAAVTGQAASVLRPDAIFASNTSTLPITSLAKEFGDPSRFIGLHFFSPVDRMKLVEVIRGKATSDRTLAVAMDLVGKLGKIAIVVNDARGFYTSRVFGTYPREGLFALSEGVSPALIENAGRMTGMPVPPLAMADEVALDLLLHIRRQAWADEGRESREAADELLIAMVDEGRLGRKSQKGFYDYPKGSKKRLWTGLGKWSRPGLPQPSAEELRKRFLYIQALEAARCLEENVATAPADADIGALLGWSFASWTGGPLSLIDTVGAAEFVKECDRMTGLYGGRFQPTPRLRAMAAAGEAFYANAA